MPLLVTLLSVVLCYFSPADILPSGNDFHIQQILIALGLVLTLVSLTTRGARLPSPQFFLMIGFWGAATMSMFSKGWMRASLTTFIEVAVIVFLYLLVTANVFTLARVRVVCFIQALCAFVMALQAIAAYHTGFMGDKMLLTPAVWLPGSVVRVRGLGVLADPNDFAQFLLVGIACLGIFWDKGRAVTSAVKLAIPSAVLLYAIYLTGSRGVVFGFGAIAFVALSGRLPGAITAVCAGLAVTLAVLLQTASGRAMSASDGSAISRIILWGTAVADLRAHPFFGVGFHQFTESSDLTAHNSFALCFAELGLFGYFFWLALIITTLLALNAIVRATENDPKQSEARRTANAVRAAILAYLAAGWFLSRTYHASLYVLLGMGAGLIQTMQQQQAPILSTAYKGWAKKTVVAAALSIAGIYVIVRARTI